MSQTTNWTPSKGDIIARRYEIQNELGKGGMARVWLATDRQSDDEVAIKHIYFEGDNYANVPGKVEKMFRQEIDVLRQVKDAGGHPNIIDIRDVVSERGTQIVVVDYIEGNELDDSSLSLSESEARMVVIKLADAMGFLHREEIIYRDLKPDNAMIQPDGSPILFDFNTAKGYDEDTEARPTCPNCKSEVDLNTLVCPNCSERLDKSEDTRVGRDAEVWKPPEAIEQKAHFRQGPWSDVYSLGKILLMLIMRADKSKQGQPRIPTVHGKGPHDFGYDAQAYNNAIIKRATKERPEKRYSNAHVLKTVLKNKDPDPPTQARLIHREQNKEYTISPGDTIGRKGADGPAAGITIDDPEGGHISAIQLQLDVDEDGNWLLRDKSLNGTYVQHGSGWERVLCESGRGRLQSKGHNPTNRHGNIPPEELPLQDGALIALVDPTYNVSFKFEQVM